MPCFQKGKYQTAETSRKQTGRRGATAVNRAGLQAPRRSLPTSISTQGGGGVRQAVLQLLPGTLSSQLGAQATVCSPRFPTPPLWEAGRAAILDLDSYSQKSKPRESRVRKKGSCFSWICLFLVHPSSEEPSPFSPEFERNTRKASVLVVTCFSPGSKREHNGGLRWQGPHRRAPTASPGSHHLSPCPCTSRLFPKLGRRL